MPLQKWTASYSARHLEQEVVDRLTRQIASNRAPWQKQWDRPSGSDLPPFDPAINKHYKGLNAIQLRSVAEEKGYNDPRWMTYRTLMDMGAQVRKGERGTRIEYIWGPQSPEPTHSTQAAFNAEQIDGLPSLDKHLPKEPQSWEVCERADQLLVNSQARIETNNESWSLYKFAADKIVMPHEVHFRSTEHYYARAVQELCHWTGHQKRLDREGLLDQHIDKQGESREMLRVHLACMTVSSQLRLPKEAPDSSHRKHWIDSINHKPSQLRHAIDEADHMAQYILQYDRPQPRLPSAPRQPAVAAPSTPAQMQETQRQLHQQPQRVISTISR